jgi:hypothetical protein
MKRPFNIECEEIKFKSLADHRKKEPFLLVRDHDLTHKMEQLVLSQPLKSA